MLFGILVSLFTILCFVLILLVLIQKGKSSMGIGAMGNQSQMLFGGSGGQDIFQKLTWVLGFIFIGGSLGLALMKQPTKSKLLQKIEQKQSSTTVSKPEPTEQLNVNETNDNKINNEKESSDTSKNVSEEKPAQE